MYRSKSNWIRMVTLSALVVLCTLVAVSKLTVINAQGTSPPTTSRLRQAAQERMQIQIEAGLAPGWNGAELRGPIGLFDMSGTASCPGRIIHPFDD